MNNPDIIAEKELEQARIRQKRRTESLKAKWKKEHYDAITILVQKGERSILSRAAKEADSSVSRFIVDSVNVAHPGLLTPLDDQSKKKKPEEEPEELIEQTEEPAEAPDEPEQPKRRGGRPMGSKDSVQRKRRTREEIEMDQQAKEANPAPKKKLGRPFGSKDRIPRGPHKK